MVSAMLLGVGQEEERGAQRSLAPRTSTSRRQLPSAGVPPAGPPLFRPPPAPGEEGPVHLRASFAETAPHPSRSESRGMARTLLEEVKTSRASLPTAGLAVASLLSSS